MQPSMTCLRSSRFSLPEGSGCEPGRYFCAREEQLNQGKWQSSNSYESDLMSAEASGRCTVRLRVLLPHGLDSVGRHPSMQFAAGQGDL